MTRRMSDAVGLVGGSIAGAFVLLIGLYANRKLGLTAARDALVVTLQGTIEAQSRQIATLMSENVALKARVAHLEQVVDDLTNERDDLRRRRRAANAQ